MDDLHRDHLPVNPPYRGWIAEAYDAWIPIGTRFPGDDDLLDVLRRTTGPSLELGCGTGRFLLRALAEGHRIEGLDDSPEMLVRCRANAAAAGRPGRGSRRP